MVALDSTLRCSFCLLCYNVDDRNSTRCQGSTLAGAPDVCGVTGKASLRRIKLLSEGRERSQPGENDGSVF